jgi:hypothetical protein
MLMNKSPQILATPWNESSGICDCCGRTSKTIWGNLSANDRTLAVYYVRWTVDAPEHNPSIDLLVGEWGDGANAQNRVLVSLLFQPSANGGAFMIVDGQGRLADSRDLCARALRRAEVVGTPLAQEVFGLVDAIWLTEPRIAEVQKLNKLA